MHPFHYHCQNSYPPPPARECLTGTGEHGPCGGHALVPSYQSLQYDKSQGGGGSIDESFQHFDASPNSATLVVLPPLHHYQGCLSDALISLSVCAKTQYPAMILSPDSTQQQPEWQGGIHTMGQPLYQQHTGQGIIERGSPTLDKIHIAFTNQVIVRGISRSPIQHCLIFFCDGIAIFPLVFTICRLKGFFVLLMQYARLRCRGHDRMATWEEDAYAVSYD